MSSSCYGPSAADVAATVDAVLDVGVVGINLEDNTHGINSTALFGIDQQCSRIAAAREAAERRDVPLVINARIDIPDDRDRKGDASEER